MCWREIENNLIDIVKRDGFEVHDSSGDRIIDIERILRLRLSDPRHINLTLLAQELDRRGIK